MKKLLKSGLDTDNDSRTNALVLALRTKGLKDIAKLVSLDAPQTGRSKTQRDLSWIEQLAARYRDQPILRLTDFEKRAMAELGSMPMTIQQAKALNLLVSGLMQRIEHTHRDVLVLLDACERIAKSAVAQARRKTVKRNTPDPVTEGRLLEAAKAALLRNPTRRQRREFFEDECRKLGVTICGNDKRAELFKRADALLSRE